MATSYTTRNGRTAKRGLFSEGVWLCDCEPRLPADKFQTKQGTKNHGRWFYTCQKPQNKRCGFFLWTDEAKIREEAAVLSNTRSEPNAPVTPKTPQKQTSIAEFPTPQTKTNYAQTKPAERADQIGISGHFEPEESFEWSSSDDEELLKAEQEALQITPFDKPRKTPRTDGLTSPGKRTLSGSPARAVRSDEIWPLSDDVFTTPSTSQKSYGPGLLSPSNTPASRLIQSGTGPSEAEPSSLAAEALSILRSSDAQISSWVEAQLVDLLNKYDLRTQGIIKGRDITRLAVQTKDRKIAEMQARISALEAEKETNRRVISHLKMDIATSPKRGKGRGMLPARRSEV
ncbi:hypothetical protein G647_03251 [Cladophialophora carrionii CBS 160.54]|uniref:GRF-type domain-containing protein n=1 Tax=Cladophialophora carrionii CBS 160.54 TaxID=1279043 RepID=V9DHV2_9EURO|nr:uncharacterized protein G647_03251 [Cladophialophora carrionii CBS 160.54]ETI26474.1 hypothetical protein G647_03251 [Cladophialophora carrionii CBS 160.54]